MYIVCIFIQKNLISQLGIYFDLFCISKSLSSSCTLCMHVL